MAEFNTQQFAWWDVSVAVGGRIFEGCTNVTYKAKREKEVQRGRGSKGHGILRGNYDYEGKLELWQSEVEAMIRDAADNDILNLRFDVIVAYTPEGGGQTVIDILKDCEITEYEKGLSQGDKMMKIELPLVFLDVLPQQ